MVPPFEILREEDRAKTPLTNNHPLIFHLLISIYYNPTCTKKPLLNDQYLIIITPSKPTCGKPICGKSCPSFSSKNPLPERYTFRPSPRRIWFRHMLVTPECLYIMVLLMVLLMVQYLIIGQLIISLKAILGEYRLSVRTAP